MPSESYYQEHDNAPMRRHRVEFFRQFHPRTGIVTRSHIHGALELLFVVSGTYLAELNHRVFPFATGDVLLIRPGVIHTVTQTGAGGSFYVLKIGAELLHEMLSSGDQLSPLFAFAVSRPDDECHFSAGSEIADLAAARVREMAAETEAAREDAMVAVRIAACSLAFEISRLLTRTEPLPDLRRDTVRRIHESIRTIGARYGEPLTPAACAAEVLMSYSAYARAFRAVTGKTFKRYLSEIRLTRAREKLLESGDSVTAIAAACGYENVSYFIKEFREFNGITPSVLRKGASRDE